MQGFLQALMEFCLPEAAAGIDWSKGYTLLDKELQAISRQQEVGKRIAYALFKIWLQDGKEIWLLVHIGLQAQEETHFADQMALLQILFLSRHTAGTRHVAINI